MNKRLHHVSLEQIMLLFKMWGQHADLREQIPYVCMHVCMHSITPPVWKTTRARMCVCLHEGKNTRGTPCATFARRPENTR